jgi:serine/threonine-protein kinase
VDPVSFGRYTLLHRIARGGMAELYLARSEMAGVARLLVIKVVSGRFSEDPSFTTMFEDEVRIASTLSHPNIGQVIDVGQVGGSYYLAMEHIHGQDLRAILKRRLRSGQTVPVEIAVQIGVKICSALQHAHEACGIDGKPLGIVHRDVSPSNVMVSFDGQVKLIDFGIAKAENRVTLTMPGTIKGKLRYLSPEQVLAQAIDARSDLFTLAITLWEATVGEHLFDGDQEVQIYEAIVKGKVRPPSALRPGYPAGLERVLLQALATKPEARYPSAKSLQLAFEQYAHEARIPFSDIEIARFMRETFADEVAIFTEAQRSGGGLVEYLRRTVPDDGSRPALLPDEGSGRSDSAIAGAGLTAPKAAPEPGSAPRKTILYGELHASVALAVPTPTRPIAPSPTVADPGLSPAPRPPTGPASPVVVTSAGQLRTGPLPQLDSDPGGRRATVIVDDARPTRISGPPAALAGLPPAREPQVVVATEGGLLQATTAVDELEGDARPTIIAGATHDDLLAVQPAAGSPAAPSGPSPADSGAAPAPSPAPLPAARVNPASAPEPVIGRDRLDLEEKRRAARAGPAETEARPPAKTGDWAHQQTGENKPGTHPYFAEDGVPPAPTAGRRGSRTARFFLVIVLLLGGAGVGLWFLLGARGGGQAAARDAGAALAARVELQSDPSGATVKVPATGKELGKTPLALELKPGETLSVELSLAGHQRQSIVLKPDTGRRKVYLVPEPATDPPHSKPAPSKVAPDARAADENSAARAPDLKREPTLTPVPKAKVRPTPKPRLKALPPFPRSKPEKAEAKPAPVAKPKKRPGDILDPFQ